MKNTEFLYPVSSVDLHDIQKNMQDISIAIARIEERTSGLPVLECRVHELHTYVTHQKGASSAWTSTAKWAAGISASLLVTLIVAVASRFTF